MQIGWTVLWGIIAISLLVTIHEFGHYWVARKLGFKVLRFSVGFGKPLLKRIGRAPDHIEYVIAAIPLGGYVRMLDERDGEVPAADRPRAFTSRPPWQRILVLLAGPAANIIFAIVVLAAMIWAKGIFLIAPVIGDVTLGKPAAEAGLHTRDVILSVNGDPVGDRGELQFKLLDAVSSDGPVTLRVAADNGAERDVILPLADPAQRFELTKPYKLLPGLGFDFWLPEVPAKIFEVIKGGPADRAGIKAGDVVLSMDGVAIKSWGALTDYVRQRPDREIAVRVRRGDGEHTYRVTTESAKDEGKDVGKLQIGSPTDLLPYVPKKYIVERKPGPIDSLSEGAVKAWEMTAAQAKFFWRMITLRISSDNLTSLITIADVAGQSASAGPASFLMLLVLLSLSLGFFNLLPIPILDGGQIVFQAAEWIRGRPLSERAQMLSQNAGLLAIVLLMGVALFNDLSTYLFPGAGK
ncbi:MAG TPA: RIP metalloprotease RseP [Steroidobacteraceae bacterium]|nr:RIP metalloprotease RseP [Steroidobacteraceae bacterium]